MIKNTTIFKMVVELPTGQVQYTYSEYKAAKAKGEKLPTALVVVPDTYAIGKPTEISPTYSKSEWEARDKPPDVYVQTRGEVPKKEAIIIYTYKDVTYVSKEAAEAAQRKDVWAERAAIAEEKQRVSVHEVEPRFAPPAYPVSIMPTIPSIVGVPTEPVIIEPEVTIEPELIEYAPPAPKPIERMKVIAEAKPYIPRSVTELTYGLTYQAAKIVGAKEIPALVGAKFVAGFVSPFEAIPKGLVELPSIITRKELFPEWKVPTIFDPRGYVWAREPAFKAGAVIGELALLREQAKAMFKKPDIKKIEVATKVRPLKKGYALTMAEVKYEIPRPLLKPKKVTEVVYGIQRVLPTEKERRIVVGLAKVGKKEFATIGVAVPKVRYEAVRAFAFEPKKAKYISEMVAAVKKVDERAFRAVGVVGKEPILYEELISVLKPVAKVPRALTYAPSVIPKVRPEVITAIPKITPELAKKLTRAVKIKKAVEVGIGLAPLAAKVRPRLKLEKIAPTIVKVKPKLKPITEPIIKIKPITRVMPVVKPKVIPRAIPKIVPRIKELPKILPKIKLALPKIAPRITPRITPIVAPRVKPKVKPKLKPITEPIIKPVVKPRVIPRILPKVIPKIVLRPRAMPKIILPAPLFPPPRKPKRIIPRRKLPKPKLVKPRYVPRWTEAILGIRKPVKLKKIYTGLEPRPIPIKKKRKKKKGRKKK